MYFQEDKGEVCSILRLNKLGGYVIVDDARWVDQGGNLDDIYDPEDVDRLSSFNKFVKELQNLCDKWDELLSKGVWSNWYSMHSKYVPKMVIEAVTATPGQEEVEEYLREIGFQSVGPISKLKHRETALTFWVMSGDEFCKSIGYTCPYDPRNIIQKEDSSSAA